MRVGPGIGLSGSLLSTSALRWFPLTELKWGSPLSSASWRRGYQERVKAKESQHSTYTILSSVVSAQGSSSFTSASLPCRPQ